MNIFICKNNCKILGHKYILALIPLFILSILHCKYYNIMEYSNMSRRIYLFTEIFIRFQGHKYIWKLIYKKETFMRHQRRILSTGKTDHSF